jgi:hypothetical protein
MEADNNCPDSVAVPEDGQMFLLPSGRTWEPRLWVVAKLPNSAIQVHLRSRAEVAGAEVQVRAN